MHCQLYWWFIIYLIIFSFHTIQSRLLQKFIEQKNESTNQNQTSKNSTDNDIKYNSISSIIMATFATTIRSNSTIQSFITKPNSYIYSPDDDDDSEEISLDRVKRETAPFVCKSKYSWNFIL